MNETYPRKSLFNTEDRTLFSAKTGREYHLSVALPLSYATSTQNYPVIYLLDGDILFGMAAGLTILSHRCLGIPEMIVVGINYDVENYWQWVEQRSADLLVPEVQNEPSDSHTDRFLAAMTLEIAPFIEANYRADPSDRALYGYSAGGFFTLYALFQQPDAFQHYISGSGTWEQVYAYLSTHEEGLATRTSNAPIQLYLSVGELEADQVPSFHQLRAFLENKKYPGLTLTTEIYTNEPHGSEGCALTYLHGIRTVYPAVQGQP